MMNHHTDGAEGERTGERRKGAAATKGNGFALVPDGLTPVHKLTKVGQACYPPQPVEQDWWTSTHILKQYR